MFAALRQIKTVIESFDTKKYVIQHLITIETVKEE